MELATADVVAGRIEREADLHFLMIKSHACVVEDFIDVTDRKFGKPYGRRSRERVPRRRESEALSKNLTWQCFDTLCVSIAVIYQNALFFIFYFFILYQSRVHRSEPLWIWFRTRLLVETENKFRTRFQLLKGTKNGFQTR